VLNELTRFERFTVFKPPALPEVFDYNEEYYKKIIDEAKNIVKGVANIQEATLKQYTQIVKRLSIANLTPIEAAKTKGTYYTYRAGWVGYHVNLIREKLLILNSIKKNDYKRWQMEVGNLQNLSEQLNTYKPDPFREQRQLAIEYDQALKAGIKPGFEYTNKWRNKAEHETIEKVKNSKKSLIRKLPLGWRDKIFKAARDKRSKHTLAIAVMICSGCRPKELEKGINIQLNEKTGEIKFLITSAKRKNETVEIRQFTLKNDSLAFRYLVSQLNLHQGNIQLRDVKYKAASTEINRLSKVALKLKKEQVSAYCFRHAFAGDLHAAQSTRTEIAQCLGHATDKTQAYYSHSIKHASGGFKISNIDSTESVKELTNDKIDKLLMQKFSVENVETNMSY